MATPRFGFVQSKKGAWEVVKISTGPWMLYADHVHALAELEVALAKQEREIQQIREHEFQRGFHEGVAAKEPG